MNRQYVENSKTVNSKRNYPIYNSEIHSESRKCLKCVIGEPLKHQNEWTAARKVWKNKKMN